MKSDFEWFKTSQSWHKITNIRLSMLPVSSAFFAAWSKDTYNRSVPGNNGKEKPARLHWFTQSQEMLLSITEEDPVLHALVEQHSFTWHPEVMYHAPMEKDSWRWGYVAEQMLQGLNEAGVTEAQLAKITY
jgi:hypothetical protein